MRTYPIVITSIYPKAPAIKAYVKKGFPVILIGDTKTPDVKSTKQLLYFSISEQKKLYKKFARSLPIKHYARKNIGYLLAMSSSDAIIETDDDNFPNIIFPNFKTTKTKVKSIASSSGFINIYRLFSK